MRRGVRPGARGWRDVLPWLAVVVFLAVGYGPMIPPSPVPATASADRFSAERAMNHVDVIARTPHPMGTSANANVRGYIVAELERLGINVERQSTTVPNFYGSGEPVPVVNLIARITGTAPTKAIALMGHYDTVPTTPGGNDNTAAVAALLETARALRRAPRSATTSTSSSPTAKSRPPGSALRPLSEATLWCRALAWSSTSRRRGAPEPPYWRR